MPIDLRKIAAVLLGSTISFSAHAQSQDLSPFCLEKFTTLSYGNGVFNDQGDARASLDQIQSLLKAELTEDEFDQLAFDDALAYNPSNGLLDLLEAMLQVGINDISSFWLWLADIEEAPEEFKDALEEIADAFALPALVLPTVRKHLDFYQAEIEEGKRVIVVAHSQGNLFANEVY